MQLKWMQSGVCISNQIGKSLKRKEKKRKEKKRKEKVIISIKTKQNKTKELNRTTSWHMIENPNIRSMNQRINPTL